METVVNKLLDVDRQAQQMLEEARAYKERTLADTEKEKEKIRQAFLDRAEKHTQDLKTQLDREVAEEIQDVTQRKETLLEGMERRFQENREGWEKTLFARCTGGDGR